MKSPRAQEIKEVHSWRRKAGKISGSRAMFHVATDKVGSSFFSLQLVRCASPMGSSACFFQQKIALTGDPHLKEISPVSQGYIRDVHESQNEPGRSLKVAGLLVQVKLSLSKLTIQNQPNQLSFKVIFG